MKNKIVDSHCHLNFDDFKDDLDNVIKNAKDRGVDYMLNISIDLEKFEEVYDLTQTYQNIWCTTGVHPNNVPKMLDIKSIEKLRSQLSQNLLRKKVVGIGETGLDYYRSYENKQNQIDFFETHMKVSGETNSPTVIHTRNADEDTIFFLDQFVKKYNSTGLIHCFSSGKSLATCALDNGFYISFSGVITFDKANKIRKIVEYVPLNKILVETDSPYLAPIPKRGKRNEPAFTKYTLEQIAKIKKIDPEEVANATTNNFFNLFLKATDAT